MPSVRGKYSSSVVLHSHTLALMAAVLAAPGSSATFGAAVRRVARLAGRAEHTHSDVANCSRAVRRLHAMGLVSLAFRRGRVDTIAARNGHRLSARRWTPARGGAGQRPVVRIDPARWAALSDDAREERLGEYATAAFRVIISNATLFTSLGLSDAEAARALGRTVLPSMASALGVTTARDRRSLLEVSRAVVGQSDEAQGLRLFASQEYPPAWAFRVPRPGRQQLEAALAVAEVVRLAQDRGLDGLARLKRFRART